MEDMEPRRRGRPPMSQVETSEDNPKPTKRRRRADVDGMHLKLKAPQREGFVRRWFNDKPGRIAEAEELAYDFVRDTSIKTDGTDSRVRRLVGAQVNGQPQYAYLMETPLEEYQVGQSEKEERHRQVEQAIREGRDATGRVSDSYGEGSIRSS